MCCGVAEQLYSPSEWGTDVSWEFYSLVDGFYSEASSTVVTDRQAIVTDVTSRVRICCVVSTVLLLTGC